MENFKTSPKKRPKSYSDFYKGTSRTPGGKPPGEEAGSFADEEDREDDIRKLAIKRRLKKASSKSSPTVKLRS